MLRAECLYQIGEFAEGLEEADAAVEVGTQDARIHGIRAQCLYILGRDEDALEAVELVCKAEPKNSRMQHLRGVLLHALGAVQDALGALNRASRLGPEDPLIHFERGRVLRQLADREAAMVAFQKAASLDPSLGFVHNMIGIIHSEDGDLESALAAWERAIESDPSDASIVTNKGKCLHKLNRHEEAVEVFRTAIKLGNLEEARAVQAALGECLAVLNRHSEAVEALSEAVVQFPGDGYLYALLGFGLRELKENEKAAEAMEKACELDNDQAKWHFIRGSILYEIGRPEDAVAALTRSLDLDALSNDAADVYCVRGLVTGKALGDSEAGAKDFEAALLLSPDHFQANTYKAMWLDEQGKPEDALELWDKVAEMEQADGRTLTNKGKCLTRMSKIPEAIQCFEEAIEASRDGGAAVTVEPFKALGALHWKQGNKNEAYVAWSMGSDVDPTDVYCHFLQGVYLAEIGEPEPALEALDKAIQHSKVPPPEVLELRNAVATTLHRIDEAAEAK